jgi:hypothetical protein
MFSVNQVTVGEVFTLKLISGEELIGKVVEDTATSITLSKPLAIAMTAKGPGLAPALMTVDPEKSITLNKAAIVIIAPTMQDVANQYIFQTTGIQHATNSIITGK